MSTADPLDALDVLLDQLLLTGNRAASSNREDYYQRMALERAKHVLRVDQDDRERVRFETRLRVALHLAPAAAIAYSRSNPVPRWRLVRDHMLGTYARDRATAEQLGRAVATVLDNWDRDRESVTGHRNFLMRRDGPACRNCHLRFDASGSSLTLAQLDDYKPYHLAPEELMAPEVDHDEAVSAMGTNDLSNLQLLCRLCNGGKGDGLGLSVRAEAAYAGSALPRVPRSHRARLVYYVIERDERRCRQCDSQEAELTIRRIVAEGALVRSNLRAICVDCAYA